MTKTATNKDDAKVSNLKPTLAPPAEPDEKPESIPWLEEEIRSVELQVARIESALNTGVEFERSLLTQIQQHNATGRAELGKQTYRLEVLETLLQKAQAQNGGSE